MASQNYWTCAEASTEAPSGNQAINSSPFIQENLKSESSIIFPAALKPANIHNNPSSRSSNSNRDRVTSIRRMLRNSKEEQNLMKMLDSTLGISFVQPTISGHPMVSICFTYFINMQ